jgi:hypothetical protein
VVVSTICPDYEVDSNGLPTYRGLNAGISPNTEVHLGSVPVAVQALRELGLRTQYLVLLADTEVDLLPFLIKLKITPSEFIARCQSSIDSIRSRELPHPVSAYRFLDFFGRDNFSQTYQYSHDRLVDEYHQNQKQADIVDRDFAARLPLIRTLLGEVSPSEGLNHLFRQRAQYVAVSRLIRQYAENRVIVVNHTTPNFVLMNHHLAREISEDQTAKGNFKPIMPLVELNISTLPQ